MMTRTTSDDGEAVSQVETNESLVVRHREARLARRKRQDSMLKKERQVQHVDLVIHGGIQLMCLLLWLIVRCYQLNAGIPTKDK